MINSGNGYIGASAEIIDSSDLAVSGQCEPAEVMGDGPR